jgi:arylsulfatase A
MIARLPRFAESVLATIFLAWALSVPAQAASPPNILFILTDDQGRQTLGCYSGKQVPTPHLDSLARDGMLFTDAYVMPQCTPTRASLFTGQHTARNGMWHVIGWYGYPWAAVAEPPFVEQLPRAAFTLPKGLRATGYVTGMAGKWHLTTNADGDYTRLKPEAADAYGFDFVAPPGPGSTGSGDKWVDHLTDEAIGFIERHRERPWFFYLSHHTLHAKISAPQELVAKYSAAGAPETGLHSATYLAAIEHLDASVGRLLKKLAECGLQENTLVVFLSDNGGVQSVYDMRDFTGDAGGGLKKLRIEREEFSNAPFRAGKGSPYEGGLRVSCLARWPTKIAAGSRCTTPIHVIDWLPTLLDIAGSKPPREHVVDGVSLVPVLQGVPLAARSLYWYLPLYDLRWGATPCAVIREGDWKLIDYFGDSFDAEGNYRDGARCELFHLGRDAEESVDLAANEPGRVAALQSQLRAWIASVPAPIPAANPHHDPERSLTETKQKQPWNSPQPGR